MPSPGAGRPRHPVLLVLVVPTLVALRCETLDLRWPGERSHFESVLRLTPAHILAPAQQALTLLSLRSESSKGPGSSKHESVEALARHADALSDYAQVLQAVYKHSGDEDVLRTLLTVRQWAMDLVPGVPLMVLRLADALFDLCRPVLQSAQRSLALFLQAEGFLGQMCNAKVVLLYKQLGQWLEGETYARGCGLSMSQLHLQHPKIQTKPWWSLKEPGVPKWVHGLRSRHAIRAIQSDLQNCLVKDPAAFDDSANDWFFVGSRLQWTGLNLMHSERGGWNERWCGQHGCAKQTCDMLRWRRELNYSLWPHLSRGAGITSGMSPPMYVNFYALAPSTHILPHLGNDGRLTVHLALRVPPHNQSRIRVANSTINYTHAGQMLIFDDAYDHEVWNDGKTTRYVLGITLWHPRLLSQLRYEVPPEVPDFHFALSWRTSKFPNKVQKTVSAMSSICRGRVRCVYVSHA